jgi:hypothetical protein
MIKRRSCALLTLQLIFLIQLKIKTKSIYETLNNIIILTKTYIHFL